MTSTSEMSDSEFRFPPNASTPTKMRWAFGSFIEVYRKARGKIFLVLLLIVVGTVCAESHVTELADRARFGAALLSQEALHEIGPDYQSARTEHAKILGIVATELETHPYSRVASWLYPELSADHFVEVELLLGQGGKHSSATAIQAAANSLNQFQTQIGYGRRQRVSLTSSRQRISPTYEKATTDAIDRFLENGSKLTAALSELQQKSATQEQFEAALSLAQRTCLANRSASILVCFGWDNLQSRESVRASIRKYRFALDQAVVDVRAMQKLYDRFPSANPIPLADYAGNMNRRQQLFDAMESDKPEMAFGLLLKWIGEDSRENA